MGPHVSVDEIARLARTMTWKRVASGLFHGGAKAGIVSDPGGGDKEAVLRAFARALSNEVPAEYVFGLDMGLTENDAATLADEIGSRGGAVGLPSSLGGLPYDRLGVTGFGVAEATDAAATCIGLKLTGAKVAIQGLGAVGIAAARRLGELGAVIVSVATAEGTVTREDGLNVQHLYELRDRHGDGLVSAYDGCDVERNRDPAQVLRSAVDVLIPAVREDVVDRDIATTTTARLVIEGANLATTRAALGVLRERGVVVVPDFIANAGGIVAAAYSMDARHSPFVVDPAQVLESVSATMRDNTGTVLDESSRQVTPHEAAWSLAQERVRDAMRARGQLTRQGGIS